SEARENIARAMTLAGAAAGFEASRGADLFAIRGKLARLEKRYDDARSDLERAIDLTTSAVGKDNPDLSDALINLGRVYIEIGQPAKAVPLLERMLVLCRDLDPSELAEPRLALAQALWQTGGDRARAID